MPFRERQKLHLSFPGVVVSPELVELPTGEFVTEMVNQSEKLMPDPELFDLKNQLEAGIQPEEVNSKVMSASSVDANSVVRKYTKKSTSTTNEVKNENE